MRLKQADTKRMEARRALTLAVSGLVALAGVAGALRLIVAASMATEAGGVVLDLGAAFLCMSAAWLGWLDVQRIRLGRSARGRVLAVGEPRLARRPEGALGSAIGWWLAVRLALLVFVAASVSAVAIDGAANAVATSTRWPSGSAAAEPLPEARKPDLGPNSNEQPGSDEFDFDRARPIGPSPSGTRRRPDESSEVFPTLFSTRSVLEIEELDSDAEAPRVMHLRGFVLDRFDEFGVPREVTSQLTERLTPQSTSSPLASPRIPDPPLGAGRPLVSNPFGERSAGTPERTNDRSASSRRLEVRFADQSNGIVFSPRRLVSLEASGATLDRKAALLRLENRRAKSFAITVESPRVPNAALIRARARGSLPNEPRCTALPKFRSGSDEAAALDDLGRMAEKWTSRAGSDAGRVIEIVRRLRDTNGYLLEDTRFISPRRAIEILDRGAGSCTQFSSTAMLMLRQLGIPARIAVGYLATDRDEERPHVWLARECDGHAWIEVHFEGLGWLTFDPTPADDWGGGATEGWTPLRDEASLPSDSRFPLSVVLARGWSWLSESRGGARIAVWLVSLCAGLWLLSTQRRRFVGWFRTGRLGALGAIEDSGDHADRVRAAQPPLGSRAEVAGLATRLFDSLERRGHSPRSSETPLAFARRVQRLDADGSATAGLTQAVTAFLRCACKGEPMPVAQTQAIQQLCERLEIGA